MEILGERREYLTIKILHNDMTVMVPTENAALRGPASSRDRRGTVEKFSTCSATTSRRCPRTGTAASSTTATRSRRATSTSSPRWSATSPCARARRASRPARSRCSRAAKKILASELMYALDKNEDEADAYLDELLADSATPDGGGRQVAGSRARQPRQARARQPLKRDSRADRGRWQGRASGRRRPKACRAGRAPDAGVEHRGAAATRRHRADRGRVAAGRGSAGGVGRRRGRHVRSDSVRAPWRPLGGPRPCWSTTPPGRWCVAALRGAVIAALARDHARRCGDRRRARHRHDQARGRRPERCARRSTAASCGPCRRRRCSAARRSNGRSRSDAESSPRRPTTHGWSSARAGA